MRGTVPLSEAEVEVLRARRAGGDGLDGVEEGLAIDFSGEGLDSL